MMLGLELPPPQKRKSGEGNEKGKKQKRKTKEELLADECEKGRQKLNEILESLPLFPDKPDGRDMGWCERHLAKVMRMAKEDSNWDAIKELEDMTSSITTVKSLCKAVKDYLPGNGLPNKRNQVPFFTAMEKAPHSIRRMSSSTTWSL